MTRKLNASTKKNLKRSLWVLIVIFILILSITNINVVVQRIKSDVATSEEMKACSSTLESIYKKLDSEEIKLLSEDGSETLTCSVPNKEFGKVTISGDSDGNLMFIYDYQESKMNDKLFTEISGILIMFLLGVVSVFGFLFSISGLLIEAKKKFLRKEEETGNSEKSQNPKKSEI